MAGFNPRASLSAILSSCRSGSIALAFAMIFAARKTEKPHSRQFCALQRCLRNAYGITCGARHLGAGRCRDLRPWSGLGRRWKACSCQRGRREFAHRLMKKAVEIEPCIEMQESGAEADCGPVHEDELARNQDGSLLLQGLVHGKGFLAAILGGRDSIRHRAHTVIEYG